jgi:hypothetical protein
MTFVFDLFVDMIECKTWIILCYHNKNHNHNEYLKNYFQNQTSKLRHCSFNKSVSNPVKSYRIN